MLEFSEIPSELKDWVGNYRMNLLELMKMEDTDVYRTDIKQVFDFFRYSKDKERLRELIAQDPAYQEMESDAYNVAMAFTRTKEMELVKRKYERGETVDMCQALTEMLKDERDEGVELGLEQEMLQILYSLVEDGVFSIRQAAERMQLTKEVLAEKGKN